MNLSEIKKYSSNIEALILKAGDLLNSYQEKLSTLKVEHKKGEGLVSEADRETESFIVTELQKIFPASEFIAEEQSFAQKTKSLKGDNLHWLIDPLDGTNNFLCGYDYFCISVAAYIQGLVVAGWVYRPKTEEMFLAVRGEGAFFKIGEKKKSRIFIKGQDLKQSMLTTGFCVEKGQAFDKEFDIFKYVMGSCRGVRRLGSAALDLCYTAKGPWGGFWEKGLSPWDTAAGSLIVEESGGVVSDYQGNTFSPFSETIVASSKQNHQELINIIGKN